ncbi:MULTISPECIES: hypothetical protein [Halococcus]|uniref:Uncharacterized protein n=1 Tax=Halococcus salifodinae DSM 8989 TaxID=1227456 RepID=M0N7J0_9EURY|nr:MULTISPECIES: hypothetical protein [Halococcus]EMA53503.1 hypothetical protein C450_09332 [Halococcus salifodinae DSM 8989]
MSDDTHPFSEEEALYAAVTTTRRSVAIPLADDDFTTGGLDHESYVNPWTVTSVRHADIRTEAVAREAAGYLGVQ